MALEPRRDMTLEPRRDMTLQSHVCTFYIYIYALPQGKHQFLGIQVPARSIGIFKTLFSVVHIISFVTSNPMIQLLLKEEVNHIYC